MQLEAKQVPKLEGYSSASLSKPGGGSSANFKLFSRNCEQFRRRTILPTQERESEKKSLQQLSPFYPNVNNKSESPPNCRRALKFSTLKNFIKIFLFEQRLIKSSQVKKSLSGGKRKNLPPIKVFLQFIFPHHNQLEKANKSETHRVHWNLNSIQ